MSGSIEPLPWEQFKKRFRWVQGEHVAVMAPTGAGKTTLIREILPMRSHVIFFGTKKRDKLYDQLTREGFDRVERFADIKPWHRKVLLWPRHQHAIVDTIVTQRTAFRTAFNGIARQGGWTAVYDEAKYMAEMLKLTTELTFVQEQLRSSNGTNISGAQRPFWLPKSVLSNASHVFLWKTTDRDDQRRLSDIGGLDRRAVVDEMPTLGKHEFIYIYTRGTETRMMRSQVGK